MRAKLTPLLSLQRRSQTGCDKHICNISRLVASQAGSHSRPYSPCGVSDCTPVYIDTGYGRTCILPVMCQQGACARYSQ